MRLRPEERALIRQAVAETFGPKAAVWLFGSRVDDRRRGGDIDLLIRPDPTCMDRLLERKLALLVRLEKALGERKIDVIVERPGDTRAIVRQALQTGVPL
ncbi:nucleotidyltransferase family protein [Rhodothermus marinus]|uniref:nucleotidyltransferase family protein n=1 Tax=Rhodothermus marinus TaxID=29549 RepID=UPI0037C61BCB